MPQSARLLKGQGDLAQRGARRTQGGPEEGLWRLRHPRGIQGEGSPAAALSPSRPGILPKTPVTTAAQGSYRVFGASEEDRPSRTTEIRPLFPPGTAAPPLRAGGPQQPPPSTPPEERAGRWARGCRICAGAGGARRGGEAGEAGAVGGSAARCCPLVEVERRGAAASTQLPAGAGREGTGKPNPGSLAKRCVFPGPHRSRGTLRVCLMEMHYWKTGRKVP